MFTTKTFNDILAEATLTFPCQCWVAYSGGLDSHVLLHALSHFQKTHPHLNMKAIHVNHGISPNAVAWAEHCLKTCEDLGVECVVRQVDVQSALGKNSLEEVARNLRYQVFKDVMGEGDYLMMAHHEDDQAETFVLQALRGAGLKGLASMPWMKPFSKGVLLRPLLNVSRESLRQYAVAEGLVWQEDESNSHDRFDRNYLRNQLFPTLLARFPRAKMALSRGAKHCAEANELLDEMAQEDLKNCAGNVPGTLFVQGLLTLSVPRQKNLLRFWIKQSGFLLPTTLKLEQLRQDVLLAQQDARPQLGWQGAQLYRFQDNLYLMAPLPEHPRREVIDWDMQATLKLPGIGNLQVDERTGEGLVLPENSRITVRFRQGGERMHPAGRSGSHPLKKLFQEWGVPPWLRDRVPLIFHQDALVMVVGYAISENYLARDNRRGKIVLIE